VININDTKEQVLASRKHALEEYINALTDDNLSIDTVSIDAVSSELAINRDAEKISHILPLITDETRNIQLGRQVNLDDESPATHILDVLMFGVSGLRLGLPNDSVDDVIDCPVNIELSSAALIMTIPGLMYDNIPVTIINPVQLMSLNAKEAGNHKIVLFNSRRNGIICNDVREVIAIDKCDVKWRTVNTKRKWLAGTIVKHQMALLDVDQLISTILGTNK